MESLKSSIWELVEPIVRGLGLELFDIDAPGAQGGVLRVYVWKGRGQGVLLDDCAAVSKALEDIVALDEMIPGAYVLEVSSPGVNRKLSRPEHFVGAVGERVKMVADDGGKGRSIRGKLVRCENGEIEVEDEESKAPVKVALASVKRAQVDFQFGTV